MKATITSTSEVVWRGAFAPCRVWEGVTERGVPFIAYIAEVQVRTDVDNAEFERELREHKAPERETLRAIDMRLVI